MDPLLFSSEKDWPNGVAAVGMLNYGLFLAVVALLFPRSDGDSVVKALCSPYAIFFAFVLFINPGPNPGVLHSFVV